MSTEFIEAVPSLTDELAPEVVVSLADDFGDVGGALPRGWYAAEVIEGFATRKGKQLVTADTVSANGSSRNLVLCLNVQPRNGEARNLIARINYRSTDFTPARIQHIKELRAENAGVRGSWQDKDAFRTNLALVNIGQLERAVGFPVAATQINAAKLVGSKIEVRLGTDDQGYNEVNAYAPVGNFTVPKKA